MSRTLQTWILFLVMALSSFAIYAADNVTEWKIVPSQSNLSFTATQNDAPVSGSFKKFTGDIHCDPAKLEASNVRIVVDMNSIATGYKDLTDTLIAPAWFNVKLFPQAVFKSHHFTKSGENKFVGNGELTIRDKSVPIVLTFSLENIDKKKVRVKGSAKLKRTAFGVGQGEWASTDEVKDEVEVNFNLVAEAN